MSDRVGMGIEQAGEKKQRGEGSVIGEGKQAKKECMQAERGGGGEGRKRGPGLLRGQTTRLTLCRLCFRT